MYCSPAPPSDSTPTAPVLLRGMGEKQTHGGAGATGVGSAQEIKVANATAASVAGGARTKALASAFAAGRGRPGVSPCLYQHWSPLVQLPLEKNLHGTLLVSPCGDEERGRCRLAPPFLLMP